MVNTLDGGKDCLQGCANGATCAGVLSLAEAQPSIASWEAASMRAGLCRPALAALYRSETNYTD
jgi:hypothetical protein